MWSRLKWGRFLRESARFGAFSLAGFLAVSAWGQSGVPGTLRPELGAAAAPLPMRTMSLEECVQLALRQSPDVLLARLDVEEAQASIRRTADPLTLKLGVGSGLAYSSGFPMNVGGSGPSIINAQASMTLLDRPLRYRVAAAREQAKAVSISEEEKRSAVALEVADVYLDAEAHVLAREALAAEIAALERVVSIRKAQLAEGRVLPLEARRAEALTARARYRLREAETALASALYRLGFLLGLDEGVAPASPSGNRQRPELPESPEDASTAAVGASIAVKRLETELAANQFRKKAAGTSHWPVVRLVSQYSMFSRFNNYDDFYNRFERHNGQIGASFELPLFTGSAVRAEISEASVESERLRLSLERARRQAAVQASDAYRLARDAQAYHELAGLDLEVARENVSVLLARVNEGKARLEELEQARSEENRLWVEYHRSRTAVEKAAYDLLHRTGQLVAWFSRENGR